MARSHHRKKHKEHLRQFQHSHENISTSQKTKAVWAFTIIGAIIGLAISYFAAEASIVWVAAGFVIGGTAGFLIGRNIDKQSK